MNFIGGGLNIEADNALVNLSGFDNLVSIGGSLSLRNNPLLASITALGNLDSIGGSLTLINNDALLSLFGLDGVEAGSIENLYCYYNASLATCEVASICNYLVSPVGAASIHTNAPGCDSKEEVEALCLVGEEEFRVPGSGFQVGVYPNPFHEIVHIEYEIANSSLVRIMIFNALGEKVALLSDGLKEAGQHQIIWNAANLPSGI